ncbi:MAG: hypothetical protein FWD68_18040 [Alphaproteobacteria bacterium]|nr:hypothetical protein [Alphaproteobacteria bacterium]
MSIFERVWNRAFGWLSDPGDAPPKEALTLSVDPRIIDEVLPLIERLIADGVKGNTYRAKLVKWRQTEQLPVTLYRGRCSFCWIAPPSSMDDDDSSPLSGLVLTPDVKIFLDPFDAQHLLDHMTAAVEKAIAKWISDRKLHKCPSLRMPVALAHLMPFEAGTEAEASARPITPRSGDAANASRNGWKKGPDNA